MNTIATNLVQPRGNTGHKWAQAGAPWVLGLTLAFLAGMAADCHAQTGEPREIPSPAYYIAFGEFYDGEYKDALETFTLEGRSAIKTSQSQWIDSICYYTMCGECYLAMGDLPRALKSYESALRLYVQFSNWMLRLNFPTLRASTTMRSVPWGASGRRARVAQFPSKVMMSQGQVDNNAPYRQGGVVQAAQLFPINAQEIVRCTILALRRRAMLLGPVGQSDELTNELVTALMRRPTQPNHWSEVWVELQLGMALLGAGKEQQAIASLQRSLVAAGEFDHPFTSTALLQLGLIALGQGSYNDATNYFIEATYAAVNYPDSGVLEEAFRYGSVAHLLANRKGMFPPLAGGLAWAKAKGLRQLNASLLLSAAENSAVLGQTKDAAKMLEDARHIIGRRSMGNGWIGARLNYLNGLTLYQQRRLPEGDAAIATAMNYMRNGSIWLFQLALADARYTEPRQNVTARLAMEWYRALLRDPLPVDWGLNPMESLAVLTTPHGAALEHWFEVAMERKDTDAALEIADRMRRHNFLGTLGFGGRVQSLRWILNAPIDCLDRASQLVRQDLYTRYPAYEQAAKQIEQCRLQLKAKPLVTAAGEGQAEQNNLLSKLTAASTLQEAIIREIAVRREPADLVFPPLRGTQQVQQSLPAGHAMLVFVATSKQLHAFLLNNKKSINWVVASPNLIYKKTTELLREIGNFEINYEMTMDDLAGTRWKQSAKELLDMLQKGSLADLSQSFEELVIVPDGFLWHVPFEALQVTADKQLRPLASRFRIRYVPTMSLAMPDGRGRKPEAATAVAIGPLMSRESEPLCRAAGEQMSKQLSNTFVLPPVLPAPSSVYLSLFDRLVVFDDVAAPETPYALAPTAIDKGKPGSTLNDWLALPWHSPEQMIYPGFHTAAENSLKKANPATAGNEVFLSVCGLMATGARTMLLSRWRTGGQISLDLSREFAQELPHTAPADAWQRAMFIAMDSRINFDAEPRVNRGNSDSPPKAEHPFFWAGYLLVDSSAGGQKADAQPNAPAAPGANQPAAPAAGAAAPGAPAPGAPAAGAGAAGAAPAVPMLPAQPAANAADDNTKVAPPKAGKAGDKKPAGGAKRTKTK